MRLQLAAQLAAVLCAVRAAAAPATSPADAGEGLEYDGGVSDADVRLLQIGMEVRAQPHLAAVSLEALRANARTWTFGAKAWLPLRRGEQEISGGDVAIMCCMGVVVAVLLAGIGLLFVYSFAPARKAELPGTDEEKIRSVEESNEAVAGKAQSSSGSQAENRPATYLVVCFVLGHTVSASTLVVVNKWAMNTFRPAPRPGVSAEDGYVWTLVLIQFLFAAMATSVAGATKLVHVDPLRFDKAARFFPAAGMFMITIVAGNAVMNYANVSTFLVLRSLVPIPTAVLEAFLYYDPAPPLLSWIGLAIAIAGAVWYGVCGGGFELSSVSWAVIFLATMPIDGVLIKHSVSESRLSQWGLVYYNNALAALPLIFFVLAFEIQDLQALSEMWTSLSTPYTSLAVLCSCVVGMSISFFQLNTRFYISATAFMVLGVVNKFLTVLWDQIFLEGEGTSALLAVCTTIGGAVLWQLSMQGSSIKVRSRSESSGGNKVFISFCLTCAALIWAGIIQHRANLKAEQ